MPKKVGDNTPYTDEIKQEVLSAIASGMSLEEIEQVERWPTEQTIMDWNRDGTRWVEYYAQAKQDQMERFVEQSVFSSRKMLNMAFKGEATNCLVQAVKVFSDNMDRQAQIHKPKKYGKNMQELPKIEVKLDASQLDSKIDELSAEIAALKSDV